MTTRRKAIRSAVLLAFGMVLGRFDSVRAELHGSKAPLTVDLGQWHSILFKLGGKSVSVPVAEVFAALAEGRAADAN